MVIAFLDASAVIYAVEGPEAWAEDLKHQLRQLAATAEASQVTSSSISTIS